MIDLILELIASYTGEIVVGLILIAVVIILAAWQQREEGQLGREAESQLLETMRERNK